MAIYDSHFGGYRVFVGDLGRRATRYDVESEFEAFGPLLDLWVARNPPGFAFLVYKYPDDAEKAVRKLHGRMVCGRRVRVEHARPFDDRRPRSKNPNDRPGGYGSRSPGRGGGGGGGGGYQPRGSPQRYGEQRRPSRRSYSPGGSDSRRRPDYSPDARRGGRSSPTYAPRRPEGIRGSPSPGRRSRSPVAARSRSPLGRRSPSPAAKRSPSPRRSSQSPPRSSLSPAPRRASPRGSLSPGNPNGKYISAYDSRAGRRPGSRSRSPIDN